MLSLIVLSVSALTSPTGERLVYVHTTWEACEAAKHEMLNAQAIRVMKGQQDTLKVFTCKAKPIDQL